MGSKTILELFKEKIFCNKASLSTSNVDNCLNLQQLEDVCSQIRHETPYLLTKRGRRMLESFLNVDSSNVITTWLNSNVTELPPLELICSLHRCGAMQITSFLYYKPEFCSEITSHLVEMITREFPSSEDQEVVKDIVKIVLSSSINVGNHSLRELFSLSSSIMESFTNTLIETLFTANEDLRLDFLNLLIDAKCVFQEGIKSFAVFLLNSLLSHEPGIISLQKGLSNHHKHWTSEFIPEKFKSLYNQLETLLSIEGVVREIELVLDDGKVNLMHLLFTVALMSRQIDKSDHLNVVKASVDKWFKDALTERNELRLGLSLIITRHHFAEVSKYYVNYANWFGSLKFKNALTFNFFFEFLSRLVPFEPAVFLKVQVTKVPSGSSTCQNVVGDYIALAKTRLLDMNQTFDYISLFNDFHETIEEQQESEVKRVISHFADNKEVNKAVLEATVFRKQYFEKVFLPSLLSVSRGTDTIRDQLIIKLNTMGKIPSSSYRIWSKSR